MADKLSERLEACAKDCDVYSPDQCATLIDGIGWIAMRALLREAAELARRVEGAQVGRVDMVCASDAVVVDELDRPVSINKKRVRLVPEPPEGNCNE